MKDAKTFVESKRIVPPVSYSSGIKFVKDVGDSPVDFVDITSSESEEDSDDNYNSCPIATNDVPLNVSNF